VRAHPDPAWRAITLDLLVARSETNHATARARIARVNHYRETTDYGG